MVEIQSRCCVVLVTASSVEEAKAIAHTLVSHNLAACVNFFPIQSVYSWNGAVQDDHEWQLLIKTQTSCWPELEQTIHELHSYDVPEIVVLPIEGGSTAYLAWIKAMSCHKDSHNSWG